MYEYKETHLQDYQVTNIDTVSETVIIITNYYMNSFEKSVIKGFN